MLIQNEVQPHEWLSSGSTLVNLAASGQPDAALAMGKYFWMVGDSSSGKTFFTLTCMAEAARNPYFDEYDFIFDNAEDGALMDLERYFGSKMVNRLCPPAMTKEGQAVYSHLTEDFYFNLDDRIELVLKGKKPPFIYLLDSMDALSTEYAGKKFKEKKTASRKRASGDSEAKAKGDFGDGKAKMNSGWIRDMTAGLRDTRSILIVLSQTRDKLDAGMFDAEKSIAAGGRALKFYASWQLWSSIKSRIKTKVHGKDRQVGIIAKLALKKNRLTGKEWTVEVPIYSDTGIDDVGSCVDFLVEEKHWKKSKGETGNIIAPEVGFEGNREDAVSYIEREELEPVLKQLVVSTWHGIQDACRIERKPRYE